MATIPQQPALTSNRPAHADRTSVRSPLVPDLHNPAKYTVRKRIPIYDVHTRPRRLPDGTVAYDEVDGDQLETICRNTMAGIEAGEVPSLFIGHTNDEGQETDQPPHAGFLANMETGDYMGRKAIFADLHVKNAWSEAVDDFPYRSVEVLHKLSPNGRISALACLKRIPERPLGTLCLNASGDRPEFYDFDPAGGEECPACEDDPDDPSKGALMDPQEDTQERQAKMIVAGVIEGLMTFFEKMGNTPAEPPVDDLGGMPPDDLGIDDDLLPGEQGGEDGLVPEEALGGAEAAGEAEGAAEEEEEPAMAQYRQTGRGIEISRYQKQIARTQGELAQANQRIRTLEARNTRSDRAVVLTGLKVDYDFDLPVMVERCAAMTLPEFERQCDDIRDHFRPATPIDEPFLRTADRGGNAARPGRSEITPQDFPALQRYAKEKGLDHLEAVESYIAEKKRARSA